MLDELMESSESGNNNDNSAADMHDPETSYNCSACASAQLKIEEQDVKISQLQEKIQTLQSRRVHERNSLKTRLER